MSCEDLSEVISHFFWWKLGDGALLILVFLANQKLEFLVVD